jgi:hypothetical protein
MDIIINAISKNNNVVEEINKHINKLNNNSKSQLFFILLQELLNNKLKELETIRYIWMLSCYQFNLSDTDQIKQIIIMLHKKKYSLIAKFLLEVLKLENYQEKIKNHLKKIYMMPSSIYNSLKLEKNSILYEELSTFVDNIIMPIVNSFHDKKFISSTSALLMVKDLHNTKIITINEITERLIQLVNLFSLNFCLEIGINKIKYNNYLKLSDMEKLDYFIKTMKTLDVFFNNIKLDCRIIKKIHNKIITIINPNPNEINMIMNDTDSLSLYDSDSDYNNIDDEAELMEINTTSSGFDDESSEDIVNEFMSDDNQKDDDESAIIDSLDLIDLEL